MQQVDRFFAVVVDYAWGWPLVALLIGGGLYLALLSRFIPFLAFRHSIEILRGKFDDPNDPGEITHFQALSTALSATVGVSNIGGVAIAITQGGPGAVFWMWIAAIVGMATKFFSCTLSCMYRRRDEDGTPQGGPMYYIELGLGPKFRPLAIFFSVCGLIGCLAMLQPNQLAVLLDDSYGVDRWFTGAACATVTAIVIVGGVKRIAHFCEALAPAMCGIYVLGCLVILGANLPALPGVFYRIVHDAFTGTALAGGVTGVAVSRAMVTGVKRAAFSNEAGIGTAPLAHGAAKTDEPVREGLVAMLGPVIDTLIVCSMTACVILTSDVWKGRDAESIEGVELTSQVFEAALGWVGQSLITVVVALFAISTLVGYSYYGRKCFAYLVGERRGHFYNYFFIATILAGAVWKVDTVINILDTGFALMALPNMIATVLLAPRVMDATRDYFQRYPRR